MITKLAKKQITKQQRIIKHYGINQTKRSMDAIYYINYFKNALLELRLFNFESSLKPQWCRTRDKLSITILVTQEGSNCEPLIY